MSKTCKPNDPKASNPDYTCNTLTGRWIKIKKGTSKKSENKSAPTSTDTKTKCHNDILSEYGIKIPKKEIFTRREMDDFNKKL